MKRLIIALAIAVFAIFAFDTASAHIEQGRHELSGQVSLMIRSVESDGSFSALTLSTNYGYFITNALEIEPELLFSKYEHCESKFIVSMNLAYNFGGSNPDRKIVPFLIGGGGISNTILLYPGTPTWGLEEKSFTVLNAGAGAKIFLTSQVALRLEYRYQQFFESRDYYYHNVFLGISAFFGD